MSRGRALIGNLGDAERVGGEYQVVSIRPSAGAVSLALAVVAVLSREILGRVLFEWLMWRPSNAWTWPLAIVTTSLAASGLGLLSGWWGLRRHRDAGRSLAWLGVIANGTVMAILLLLAAAFLIIRFT